MKKILLVGNINDNHFKRFIQYINGDAKFEIDLLSHTYTNPKKSLSIDTKAYNNLIPLKRLFPVFLYKNSKIELILQAIDFRFAINKLKNNYDIVNVHYPIAAVSLSSKKIKSLGANQIITPWGSDVYRASSLGIRLCKRLYNQADYVSCFSQRFTKDITSKFDINPNKFQKLGFGTIIIDLISESDLSSEQAKKKLAFENKYIIAIGYNNAKAQNHLTIIDEIAKIKTRLPEDYILLFQMTYPNDDDYRNEVRQRLEKYDLRYIMYTKYLTDEEVVTIRKATDLFIHLQKTDAYSGSVQEFLLTDTKVINGKWLSYPDLEADRIPYHQVSEMNELPSIILEAINNEEIKASASTKATIQQTGWKYQAQEWRKFYSQLS